MIVVVSVYAYQIQCNECVRVERGGFRGEDVVRDVWELRGDAVGRRRGDVVLSL